MTAICDPAGHFCIQPDTTSARVCAPMRPGGLNAADCEASDAQLRIGGGGLVLDALVARFDEWKAIVLVIRTPPRPEAASGAETAGFWDDVAARMRPAGWLAERVQEPVPSRVHDVQVVRTEGKLSSGGVGGVVRAHFVGYEVRARGASYVVLFQGGEKDAARVGAFADQTMATLDAVPLRDPHASGEALGWLLRGALLAAVIVGIAWWLGRRKGRRPGIDARDLWPR